ncbi:MAG: adenylate/guanylate cyclase domain-containing protein [Bacteroidota bacterium]
MSTRRLAAIMFTDIVGYTALMQESESRAIEVRSRHREVFERFHEQYQGEILQYYGDGTLSIFDSAVAATQCAIDMQIAFQEDPKVPLRIGIHTGDILYSKEEAIGDGVNIASRVETIASPGSVMVSERVAEYLKNQSEIPLASMGSFTFKNVKEEIEVFAVDRPELDVPSPKNVKGKFIKHKGPNEKTGLAKLPIWARYIGGFALFLVLAPIIYFPLYRFATGEAANIEGINVSAEQTAINYENQIRFFVSAFEYKGQDSTQKWLGLGMPYALEMDWDQDPHILNIFVESEEPKPINSAIEQGITYNCNYLLRGEYDRTEDGGYQIDIKLHHLPSGQLFDELSFQGTELFSLLDSVSLRTKMALGIESEQLAKVRDLPTQQILTSSMPAYQRYCEAFIKILNGDFTGYVGGLAEATEIDSTFAWGAYTAAQAYYQYLRSDESSIKAIDLAMRHRKRLPEVFEARVKQLKFRIYDEPEKALQLSQLLVELHPGNFSFSQTLINDLFMQERYEEVLTEIDRLQAMRKDPCELFYVEGNCLLRLNKIREGLKRTKACQEASPNSASLAQMYAEFFLADGKYEEAGKWFQRAELLESQYLAWDKLAPHIDFMQDSADKINFEALYEGLTGRYYSDRIMTFYFNVSTNGHQLYINGPRQQKYPYYPVSSHKFIATPGHQAVFEYDEAGNPIAVLGTEPSGRSYRLEYVDSNLDEARAKLTKADFASAKAKLEGVPEAYQNGWLYEAIKDAVSYEAEEVAADWDKMLGEYAAPDGLGVNLFIENNRLFATFIQGQNLDPFPIFPINETDFVNTQYLGRTIRLVKEGESVVAVEIVYPDKDPIRFNRVPS